MMEALQTGLSPWQWVGIGLAVIALVQAVIVLILSRKIRSKPGTFWKDPNKEEKL